MLRRRCVRASRTRPSPPRSRLVAALLLCVAAAGLHAQDAPDLSTMSLEDLLDVEIVTASRFEQSISHAPSAVQVISADDIRTRGWRTLAEALASLPGLYLSDTGLYTYLGARGQLRAGDYNTRFLLLINGHRVNDPVYSQSPVGGEFPLDMSLVERIEYVPGPGSAVYGSNAFFGVINVLTRDASTFGEGELRAGVASFGTTDLQVSVPVAAGGATTLLSARQFHTRGRDLHFPEFADTPSGGHVRGQDDERVRQLFISHRQGGLALQLVAGDRRKEDPVAPYEQTFAAPGAEVQDRWIDFGAHYQRRLGGATDASARLDVIDYRYLGDYVYGEDAPYLNRDVASGLSVVLGGQLVTRASERHTLVAGAEVQFDRSVVQRNFDVRPYASYLDSRENTASWGVFVDNEIRLSDAWRFSGGLRADRSDLGTLRLSPRMALISARPDDTVFKLIVGQSYRSPNAYERYYEVDSDEGAQLANPGLGAEHVQTAELFYGVAFSPRSRAELSVYRYRLRDLITLVEVDEGVLTLTNAGRASSRGAELAYVHRSPGGLLLRASYAYAEVADALEPRPLNAPRGNARVSASWPLATDLGMTLSAQHVGRRASRSGTVPAYSVVNAHLLWQPRHLPLALSLGVRNLLDARYADPVGPEFAPDAVERRGRELRLETTWRF
ncbi:TonB-dependent receptor plug domain-containing protein [Luteimonas saliphila]|uniref:TonB-dependent receptor plug domain-containing protein n=1 Tax=Luteimonas saliphila TaxID=2804919 RepID=UPI00192DCA72|nr:TonB-dependent receptor [Luteimonas saliphila]